MPPVMKNSLPIPHLMAPIVRKSFITSTVCIWLRALTPELIPWFNGGQPVTSIPTLQGPDSECAGVPPGPELHCRFWDTHVGSSQFYFQGLSVSESPCREGLRRFSGTIRVTFLLHLSVFSAVKWDEISQQVYEGYSAWIH